MSMTTGSTPPKEDLPSTTAKLQNKPPAQPGYPQERELSDDPLSKMLDDALQTAATRDSAQKTAKQKHADDMKIAGEELRQRVLPRLLVAQKTWEGKLKLDISDKSNQFNDTPGARTYPMITVSTQRKQFASYTFSTHHPGYATVLEGDGPNRGNKAYEFELERLDQLTDAKVDEVLKALVDIAVGLKPKR